MKAGQVEITQEIVQIKVMTWNAMIAGDFTKFKNILFGVDSCDIAI